MNENILDFEGDIGEFKQKIASTTGLVLVDFYASWCGPCQRLRELLQTLSKENNTVQFINIDVDKAPIVATEFKIEYVPDIKFLRNSDEGVISLGEIHGLDPSGIRDSIERFK